MNETILITGASGFIGTNLLLRLQKEKADVLGVSRTKPAVPVPFLLKDISEITSEDIKDVRYVVHLAAISSPVRARILGEAETFRTNVAAQEKFLKLLSTQRNIKKVITMSSIVVYKGEGKFNENDALDYETPDIYTKSKIAGEEIAQQYAGKLPLVIFRLSNSYGPHQQWKENPTLIPQFFAEAMISSEIKIMNSSPVRDFIHAEDVCAAIIAALQSEAAGVFNLGTGNGTSISEVAGKISSLTHTKINFEEDVKKESVRVNDISKIQSALKWKPRISIAEGLQTAYRYYQKEIPHKK